MCSAALSLTGLHTCGILIPKGKKKPLKKRTKGTEDMTNIATSSYFVYLLHYIRVKKLTWFLLYVSYYAKMCSYYYLSTSDWQIDSNFQKCLASVTPALRLPIKIESMIASMCKQSRFRKWWVALHLAVAQLARQYPLIDLPNWFYTDLVWQTLHSKEKPRWSRKDTKNAIKTEFCKLVAVGNILPPEKNLGST